jgi:hypothetical protein
MNLRNVKYKLRYPRQDKIIFVDPEKLLDRLTHDEPDYDIRIPKNQIGSRLQRAKEFIQKYWNDPKEIFEPSLVEIGIPFNNKISFGDGRHRVLAAFELGIPEIGIEIPRKQEHLFDYMKANSMNESKTPSINETVDEFMNLFELFLKLNERNKWIYADGFKMYVRKSKRFYNGKAIDFIDLATIESDIQGTGLFTLILKEILKKYKDKNFYVENVMTDRFLNFFRKFGFIDYPMYDRCLIKISDEFKFEKFLNESPDAIIQYGIHCYKKDALPFISNKDGSIVNIGVKSGTHRSVKNPSLYISQSYSGRMWFENKIMAFWSYPNKETFVRIIDELEKN